MISFAEFVKQHFAKEPPRWQQEALRLLERGPKQRLFLLWPHRYGQHINVTQTLIEQTKKGD